MARTSPGVESSGSAPQAAEPLLHHQLEHARPSHTHTHTHSFHAHRLLCLSPSPVRPNTHTHTHGITKGLFLHMFL